MARTLNKVMLIGRLGRDPEIRYSTDGLAIANFSVATDESYKDRSGNRQTQTEWHRIVAFGKLAEICGEYLMKGRQVYIEGRLKTRSWTDKNGDKKYTTEIIANNMFILDAKSDYSTKASPETDEIPSDSSVDDDIPF
jgi:single-strand DNA-binding protein